MVLLLLQRGKAFPATLMSCIKNTGLRTLGSVANTSRRHGKTLKYQETLPKFPVPPLNQTFQNYLRQYKLYVTGHEYERTKTVVEDFCKPGGTGDLLQHALLRRSHLKENWLSDWWRSFYLQVREPIVLKSSPGILMHRQEFSDLNGQIQCTAKLLFSMAWLISSLARHELPTVKMGKQPICMDQFFLGATGCRIPGKLVDTFHCHRVDLPDAPRHVVVVYNNNMFKFDILHPDKSPLDAASMLKQLEFIVNKTYDQGPPVGLLTAHTRTRWAEIYSKMKKNETNFQSLNDIENSLFVLSLDQTEAVEDAEERLFQEARLALCGGGSTRNTSNRWHDKTLQLFVGSNGEIGIYGDHSHVDGVVALTAAEVAFQCIKNTDKLTSDSAHSCLPPPQKLKFVLSDDLICTMAEAGKHIDHILGYFTTQEKTFLAFGKRYLKDHKVAFDGFVQIAIQMAYWRLFGKLPRVFEAVSLQRFKLGRVENVRTVTRDSAAFIKTFYDDYVKSVDKLEMLHKAIEVHMKGINNAQNGQGMERHLFGLQRIAEENKIDASEFYDDPSWKMSCDIDIRTTALQGDASRALYAPMIQTSCVFLSYSFSSDFMRFTITARKDKTAIDVNDFLEGLFACMLDLKDLLESV